MISYFNNRLNQLFNQIEISGYDGFYITNMTNIRYLTGFTGSSAILFILNQKAYFLTDGRYIVQSKNEVKNSEIFIIDKSYFDTIKNNILKSSDKLSIGFESDVLSVSHHQNLLKFFPSVNWEPTSSIIENIAAVKDQQEIESLKTAIEITDYVFTQILPEIKEGVSEKYIAAKISL